MPELMKTHRRGPARVSYRPDYNPDRPWHAYLYGTAKCSFATEERALEWLDPGKSYRVQMEATKGYED